MCNSLKQSMRYQGKSALEKGAISTRLTKVISPVNHGLVPVAHHHKTGSSTYKQENTDSEFWNLTADDESQVDPVLVMRNINLTNLNSVTNSLIQIQEADNKTASVLVPSHPSNTVRQSFNSYFNEGRPTVEDSEHQRAYKMPDIEQYDRGSSRVPRGATILAGEEPIEVQLIQNDGNRMHSDAHVKEFSPAGSTPVDLQGSYGHLEPVGTQRSQGSSTDSQACQTKNPSGVRRFDEGHSQDFNGSSGVDQDDKDLSDSIRKDDGMISSLRQSTSSAKKNPQFTTQQARRSAMVPMMEERVPGAHHLLLESSQLSSKSKQLCPPRTLPQSLQRQGNEIIHQILLDEVFEALDEVLGLSRTAQQPPQQPDRLSDTDSI